MTETTTLPPFGDLPIACPKCGESWIERDRLRVDYHHGVEAHQGSWQSCYDPRGCHLPPEHLHWICRCEFAFATRTRDAA